MNVAGLLRYVRLLMASVFVVAVVGACGGVDSGGTGASYQFGSITGFGSIIVNQVRIDERQALIRDDDDRPLGRSALRLGVVTEVEAGAVTVGTDGRQRSTATAIRVRRELVGPVASVDPSGSSLRVLDQTVLVTAGTVIDARFAAGIAGLVPGATVAVYGRYDATRGAYTATRVEPVADPTAYKLRGIVSSLDHAAGTLAIGPALIDISNVPVSADVRVGELVRVTLAPGPVVGPWTASLLESGAVQPADADEAKVEGRITALVSTRSFSVNGVTVDARWASFPDGEAEVVLGARVEVEGSVSAGILRAEEVELEGDEDDTNSSFEIDGNIESIDPVAQTFVLRGVTVSFGGPVIYDGGSAADLAVGGFVEVDGVLSSDGTRIEAQEINFDDG